MGRPRKYATEEERKEARRIYKKKYDKEHREQNKKNSKAYNQSHKEEIRKQRQDKIKNDPEYHEKLLESKREYYQRTKDTIRKEYLEKNKDKIREQRKDYFKKYSEENRERLSEQKRQYYQDNKERIKANVSKRNKSPAPYDLFFEKLNKYNECRRDPNNPELLQVRCKYSGCQKWFNPTIQQCWDRYKHILGKERTSSEMYCSDECKSLCPIYRKQKYPEGQSPHKTNNNREVQAELRELVLARDNYTCQHEGCHKSQAEFPDLKLVCHHIFPLNEDPVGSADIDNCITVCEECHRWIHKNVPGCGTAELRCSKEENDTLDDNNSKEN